MYRHRSVLYNEDRITLSDNNIRQEKDGSASKGSSTPFRKFLHTISKFYFP